MISNKEKIREYISVQIAQADFCAHGYVFGANNKGTSGLCPEVPLLLAPAFRAMYYKTIGNTITEQNTRGKLLEDLIGMYLYRLFDNGKKPAFSLTYDSAKGGADFVVGVGEKKIVIEVGINKTEYKQVVKTAKKINSTYNIIISERVDELEYNEEGNAVKIPLKYFLLT